MTTTLNASTAGAGGFIATSDNSGILALQSAGTTKFTADSTGAYGQVISGTAVATTSGTSIDFTSIPSWVKRITVMLAGVSTNGSSSHILQIGDSGGIENTSYVGSALTSGGAGGAFTTGYGLTKDTGSTSLTTGVAVIALLNSSTNLWAYSFCGAYPNDNTMVWGGGYKALSAVLDRVRLTTVNGTDTFDAGSINILYEG
jgi:hypothetical protein